MSMLCSFTTRFFFFLIFFFFSLVCGIVSYGFEDPRFFCDWFMVTWMKTSVTSTGCRVF